MPKKDMKLAMTLDKWLSQALGIDVFVTKVRSLDDVEALKKEKNNKRMIYAEVGLEQPQILTNLIREHFEWIDTSVVFSQKKAVTDVINNKVICRFAESSDQSAILAVGTEAFKHADFYVGLPNSEKIAPHLKISWLQNFFQSNHGDALIVAEQKKEVVGFLQLSKKQNQWNIDILAVCKKAQKQGIAKNLIAFINKQFGLVSTSTNLANINAIQFYEDCFFQLKQAYHILVCHQKS